MCVIPCFCKRSRSFASPRSPRKRFGRIFHMIRRSGMTTKPAGAAGLRPQVSRQPHGCRRKGQVFEPLNELMEIAQGNVSVDANEFGANFVVCDFRNNDSTTRSQESADPLTAGHHGRRTARMAQNSERGRVENQGSAHDFWPSSGN